MERMTDVMRATDGVFITPMTVSPGDLDSLEPGHEKSKEKEVTLDESNDKR